MRNRSTKRKNLYLNESILAWCGIYPISFDNLVFIWNPPRTKCWNCFIISLHISGIFECNDLILTDFEYIVRKTLAGTALSFSKENCTVLLFLAEHCYSQEYHVSKSRQQNVLFKRLIVCLRVVFMLI